MYKDKVIKKIFSKKLVRKIVKKYYIQIKSKTTSGIKNLKH